MRDQSPLNEVANLPGVAEAVDEARAAIDRLQGHRVVRSRSAEVSAESALRGARASASLEGADLSLENVRAGAESSPVARGAVRLSGELGTLLGTWHQAPRQVLARLHVLAATDLVPSESLGRPRADRSVNDPLSLGAPPSPDEVSMRLDALARILVSDTRAPAVVVAAITHGELLALRPFGRGDGTVARAAERLTLISRGLDPKALSSPEAGHLELAEGYGEAARDYVGGTQEGVAAWVRHCAQAVSLGARESTAICEALLRAGRK